ncbi:PI31 proteasome regulator N-terminal-domain-containing protein [Achaetomium macrosporum]|uniref:PI31 proteasome regulator N-terminal-domain-containing protein n=1 Tax=Achaetomium macrosporum TaxID=79813 RepID=A0AAN7C9E1_9PEZI|nr:PI31 proteasome regulator N-terminal-domain-containing protein [Achaetomium macrosporum]
MTRDPLGPAAVAEAMANALPTHDKDDTTSDLSSSLDCVALFVHACMANLGFRLLGFNEDRKIETECARTAPRLPAQWNKSLNTHCFVYAHTQSSMQFIVHIDRMGAKIEVRGLAIGDDRIARFDITARDYISSSALPLRIRMTEDGAEDRSDLLHKLKTLFISEERIKDLASLLKVSLIQRLLPSLYKEGYTEEPAADRRTTPPPRPHDPNRPPFPSHLPPPAAPNPYPAPDPLAAPPPRPVPAADFPPPDFEDEYEVNRPPRGPIPFAPSGGFGGIGQDDLYPAGLGPHDPIRGSFTGPGGLRRPGGGLGGGARGGGGMHPTFDDPLFQGPRGGGDDGDDTFGGQVPPGARWDPLGPGGQPRFGGGRPGGRGGGGFGGFGWGDII